MSNIVTGGLGGDGASLITGGLVSPQDNGTVNTISPARASMALLLTRLRRMIADETAPYNYDDLALQDALDLYQVTVRYQPLTPKPLYQPGGGQVLFYDFFADAGNWESDAIVYDRAWTAIAPSVSNFLVGKWTFTTSQLPTLYISGQWYDLYGAAADILEDWAARLSGEYDFSTSGVGYKRSQAAAMKLKIADRYRMRQLAASADIVRSDVNRWDADGLSGGLANAQAGWWR